MVGLVGMVELLFQYEWVDYNPVLNLKGTSGCSECSEQAITNAGEICGIVPTCKSRPIVKKGSIIQLLMTLGFCTPRDGSDAGLADQRSPPPGYG